tara:strand:+ start:2440 stop:3024 length:585 start_codon:yes stop_codon:yes gene_type:complete
MLKTHFSYHHKPDVASRRTFTLKDKFFTFFRLFGRRNIKIKENTIIGKNVIFRLTDDAKIEIGNNSIIDHDVSFYLTKPKPFLQIGNHVAISKGTVIACKSIMQIGDYTRIATNVVIRDNTHKFSANKLLINTDAEIKEIIIGKNVWIGDKVIIFPGVKIGDNAIISAGSIVTSEVRANTIVAGQPARFIKKVE